MRREPHLVQECKQDEVASFLNQRVQNIKATHNKHKCNIYGRYHMPNELMGQEIQSVCVHFSG